MLVKGCRVFKPDSRFECVPLRAIVDFNILHEELTSSHSTVQLETVSDHDLATPRISVVSNNSDVSGQKYNLSSRIDSIVGTFSGSGLAPMVVFEVFSEDNFTSSIIVAFNRHVVDMVRLNGSRQKSNLVTGLPVEVRVD